ncbi:MAG: LysM peptidoglycan-binding domain-containing protein [Acidobacteria bacterium]|nr:LysM peptidoglycan-binding domain-containing protein [Acidobacteriota bacterium]
MPDRRPEPGSLALRSLLEEIESGSSRAVSAFEAGDREVAKERFQEALDLILDSEFDLASTPSLRQAFVEVVDRMNATDLKFLPETSPTNETWESAASDELSRIDPDIVAKKPAKEKGADGKKPRKITYDIPVEVNDTVLSWIEIYQTRLRPQFEVGLRNSGRFMPMILKIFAEEGVPLDLAYMAHVESSYKTRAYSRAKAMGIWQFIQSTGRVYGLHRDDWVDDRANPEKATRAAARHLKDLYETFDDWYLAMAAYNAGSGRVRSAIRRTRSRDFWVLRRTRYLRRETRNYVPAILATILIAKDLEKYGFHVEKLSPWEFDLAEVESMTDLRVVAKCAGVDVKEVRELNPELRWLTTPPIKTSYTLRLPAGTKETFAKNYSELPADERVLWVRHRVRRGETLSVIARRYGTTIRGIQGANGIRNRHRIRQNTVLMIPVGPHGRVSASAAVSSPTYKKGQRVRHRVRRGESLSTIARRYRTDVGSLCAWNQLSPTSIIYAGERLTVYYRGKADQIANSVPAKIAGGSADSRRVKYRIRRGDTLSGIAKKFRTNLQSLCQWNGISHRDPIFPGETLIVYSRR